MEDLYPWIVFAHVAGGFVFALGHGVSLYVAFKVRGERDAGRLRALLELSGASLPLVYAGLLVLLVAGLLAAVLHGWLRYAWPWIAIIVLVVTAIAMVQRGSGYYNRVRHAVGMRTWQDHPDSRLPEPASFEALDRLLTSNRPEELTITGVLGLGAILWLMVAKPI